MIKEKLNFSIVEEYNGFLKNIYNYVKPLETDFVDILQHDGSNYDGYWSHTVGDISIRYMTDLSVFYYGSYHNLPDTPVKNKIAELVKYWAEEIEEETKNMDEDEKREYEDNFFSDAPTWACAYIDVMVYDKSWLNSEEQREFEEFDNIILIETRLKDEYGHHMGDIVDEFKMGINKDSDMNKILEIVKKEIDKKVDVVEKYFGE